MAEDDEHEELTDAGTATLLLNDFGGNQLNQLVIEGAPGQGKSTLAQYICQVNRVRLLDKQADLPQLPSHHKRTPLRMPFKVDLRDLATWLGGHDPFDGTEQPSKTNEPRTLETFLARLVRHHCGGIGFDVNDLLEMSKLAPMLVVLDGLDEVADIKRRAEVVSAVSKAIVRMRENCKGLRVVITSRPAAFANSPGFDSDQFPHLQLGSVKRRQIQLYAKCWMDVRNLSRKEKAEFQSILDEKMEEPHLRDLARNPMQLAILLSLIHTRGAALPDKRTSLYDAYVELFFSRESAKSVVVRQHIELLKDIHRYLAWLLHSNAEIGRGRTGGRISSLELKKVLHSYLQREQHSTVVVDEVFGAMLERVVMIVSRIQGTYEFEVQSLRKYFAARYLYDTSPYSPPGKEKTGTKPDRFDAVACNFYWLNVARFFSGCFSKGELLDLADRVKELIGNANLGKSRHPVVLGAMLLADWVFAQSPKAVSEVAAALSAPDALRRLLPKAISYRREQVLQIPARCGGAQIVERAFDFLEDSNTRADLRRRLAEFIGVNCQPRQVDERWLASARRALAGDVIRWLQIGRELGSLGRVESESIAGILGGAALDKQAIGFLCREGRHDCLSASNTSAYAIMEHTLCTPPTRQREEAENGPLYLIPSFLGLAEFWTIAPGHYIRNPLAETAKRFREADSPAISARYPASSVSLQAFQLSCKIAEAVRDGSVDLASAAPWEALIEDCRQAWGDWPAITAAANAVCHLSRGSRAKLPTAALLAHDQPICRRIRVSKLNANNGEWWMKQLEEAKDSRDRFLFHLAYWTWVPLSVTFGFTDRLAGVHDALPSDEWSKLLSFLLSALDRGYYLPANSPPGAGRPLPRRLISRRLAFLVGLKDQVTYGRAAFLLNLNSNRPISAFRVA